MRLILVGGQSIIASSNSSSGGSSGGGNDKYKLYQQTQRLFPIARIVQTYACTEAGSSITFEELLPGEVVDNIDGIYGKNRIDDGSRHNNDTGISVSDDKDSSGTSVGYPPSHIQIEIFHPEASNIPSLRRRLQPLPHGQTGITGTHAALTSCLGIGIVVVVMKGSFVPPAKPKTAILVMMMMMVVVVGCSPMILDTSILGMESYTFWTCRRCYSHWWRVGISLGRGARHPRLLCCNYC